jgi:hypothetical protein
MSSIGFVYEKNKQKAINFFLELVFNISKSFYSRQQDTPGLRHVTDLPVIMSTFI